jgi:hypothetical protein
VLRLEVSQNELWIHADLAQSQGAALSEDLQNFMRALLKICKSVQDKKAQNTCNLNIDFNTDAAVAHTVFDSAAQSVVSLWLGFWEDQSVLNVNVQSINGQACSGLQAQADLTPLLINRGLKTYRYLPFEFLNTSGYLNGQAFMALNAFVSEYLALFHKQHKSLNCVEQSKCASVWLSLGNICNTQFVDHSINSRGSHQLVNHRSLP